MKHFFHQLFSLYASARSTPAADEGFVG